MQVKTTIYYYWFRGEYSSPEGTIEVRLSDYLKNDSDYVLIDQQTVEKELPDTIDKTKEQIENLVKEKTKILADAWVQAGAIDERIQSYLALENKPEVTTQPEETEDDIPF